MRVLTLEEMNVVAGGCHRRTPRPPCGGTPPPCGGTPTPTPAPGPTPGGSQ